MSKVAPSDSLLAAAVRGAQYIECPQSLIDMMPSADEYIARLESLARDFMPPEPVLTCTTLDWWIDRVVAHLSTRDVHPASTTIQ